MKLLFNRSPYNGSTELKQLLGFIDADIKFDKIKPDIITATSELQKMIGKNMYESVIGIYEADSRSEDQETLLYLTRYPIAVKAYMLLAPSNDIAHTANGRKMRQDNNEKQAFEFMLDRDNDAMERRYYRALDDLLEHLDGVSGWKESDAYKASHKLFIRTTSEFDEFFPIDSRLVLLKLAPGIRQCEQNEILPLIGPIRFADLKAKLTGGSVLTEVQDLQLLYLIKEACVYFSLAWAMMRLSVKIFPDGVLQAYTSDRMTTKGKLPAVKSEPEAARQAFMADAAAVFKKIEMLLAPAPLVFPNACDTLTEEFISGTKFLST
jgi:hypothetical protein